MGRITIGAGKSTPGLTRTEEAIVAAAAPVEPITIIQRVEVPVEVIREVTVEVVREVQVPVEVIKEVTVEVIRIVEKEVPVIQERIVIEERIVVQEKVVEVENISRLRALEEKLKTANRRSWLACAITLAVITAALGVLV